MLNNTTTSAMTFAVKLLGLRNHSREELKRKLLRKGYAPEKIEPVLDKLTAQGVLDDMIFSIELIKSRSRRYSMILQPYIVRLETTIGPRLPG